MSISSIVRGLLGAAAVGVAAALCVGQAGALHPVFDGVGHLRGHFAAAAFGLALVSLIAGGPRIALAASAAGLFGLLTMALTPPAAASSREPADLTLLTFNTLYRTQNVDEAEALLRRLEPDIVFWQEYQKRDQALGPRITDVYPHQLACSSTENCGVALFSKRPWTEASVGRPENTGRVSTAWARFEPSDAPPFTVMSVHPRKPDRHGRQRKDYAVLVEQAQGLAATPGPLIVAGDFNATPWSFVLKDFARRSGLRWARHFAPTYSAQSPALFQIDHVLVSDDVRLRAIERKPASGSDHYPIWAELVFTDDAPNANQQTEP